MGPTDSIINRDKPFLPVGYSCLTSLSITRVRQPSREFLRKPRDSQNVFRGSCGTPANAKKFLERLAGLPQTPKSFPRHLRGSRKRQKVFRGTCSIPANAIKFFGALAALLQTPKSFSGHLQHSCKRQKVFRSICSIPANAKKFFEAFAASLQVY